MGTKVDLELLKRLRAETSLSMAICKDSLVEADNDYEKAVEIVRKKGLVKASERSERATSAGIIHSYIHTGAQVGVILELQCETDFVARNAAFKELANDIAMHIAAINPLYLSADNVPEEDVWSEKQIIMAQPDMEKKPDNIKEKIAEGRMQKFYKEVCLLEQDFVKDQGKTVREHIMEAMGALKENITLKSFTRMGVGGFSMTDKI